MTTAEKTANDERIQRLIDAAYEGMFLVAPGISCFCSDCRQIFDIDADRDPDEVSEDISNQDIIDEGSFSWSSCDMCGATDGGQRYVAHGVSDDLETTYHMDICSDCIINIG